MRCCLCNTEINYPESYMLRMTFDYNKDPNEFAHKDCITEPMEVWCEVAKGAF